VSATSAARRAVLAAAAAGAVGCASSWSIRTSQATYALQWPPAPNPPKLTFVRALSGFSRSAGAGAALNAVVYGSNPPDENGLVLPAAVAVSNDDRVAVADMGRACVHLFSPAERRYVKLTGSREAPMRTPVAVVFDDQGRLYASDSSGAVYAFSPEGTVLLTIRSAGEQPLRRPTGLAFNARLGVLYVVDTLAHRVYAFDRLGALAFAFGGQGAADGRFNFPTHITISPRGEVLVVDSLNFRVQVLDERGNYLASFGHHGDGSGDLARPKGVAVDGDGVVYVADALFDVVQLFDRSGTFLLTLGRRGQELGEFWMPSGLFIKADLLYVCDPYNHRVQVFRISEGYGIASH
jgi:DNA-binding beta-propeller fold protein YncE